MESYRESTKDSRKEGESSEQAILEGFRVTDGSQSVKGTGQDDNKSRYELHWMGNEWEQYTVLRIVKFWGI